MVKQETQNKNTIYIFLCLQLLLLQPALFALLSTYPYEIKY